MHNSTKMCAAASICSHAMDTNRAVGSNSYSLRVRTLTFPTWLDLGMSWQNLRHNLRETLGARCTFSSTYSCTVPMFRVVAASNGSFHLRASFKKTAGTIVLYHFLGFLPASVAHNFPKQLIPGCGPPDALDSLAKGAKHKLELLMLTYTQVLQIVKKLLMGLRESEPSKLARMRITLHNNRNRPTCGRSGSQVPFYFICFIRYMAAIRSLLL
jgi:hypothetical protein